MESGSERTLREKQAIFHRCLARLILWAWEQGIEVVVSELYRDPNRQLALFHQGKTRTLNSLHLQGLAADLLVIRNKVPVLRDVEEYHILGRKWEEMGGIWGGRWQTLNDIFHFEYSPHLKDTP